MNRYIVAGAVFLSAVLGWTSYQKFANLSSDPFAACRSGNVAGGAIGGPFVLLDEKGQTVTDAQILSRPALVYFGFASCADVCPLDNGRNVEAASILAGLNLEVTPIFVSVDPNRDTPEVLSEYTDNFGVNLLGLTGTPEQIKIAAQAYKVYYNIPADTSGSYDVDHTTMTYLMLPKTGFAEFFERNTSAQEMADRTSCFLKAS